MRSHPTTVGERDRLGGVATPYAASVTSPSLTLTLWAGAWLGGHASPDDVIDALHTWAPTHVLCAADDDVARSAGLPERGVVDGAATLLTTVRTVDTVRAAGLRLVLAAPGDARGLPAGTAFAAAAMDARQGILVGVPGAPGAGLVPVVEGPDVLRWTVFTVDPIPDPGAVPSLGEAEFAIREAVRDAAATLTGIPTVGSGTDIGDPRSRIASAAAELARHRYPSSLPVRAARVLDSADQVEAILTVAAGGGAERAGSASGTSGREEALRALSSALRVARSGAVAAALHGH